MTEVSVGQEKSAVLVEDLRYLGKFLRLRVAHIFKEALSHDDIKPLVAEPDGTLKKVASMRFGAGLCTAISIP